MKNIRLKILYDCGFSCDVLRHWILEIIGMIPSPWSINEIFVLKINYYKFSKQLISLLVSLKPFCRSGNFSYETMA